MSKRGSTVATPKPDGTVSLRVCQEPGGKDKPRSASKMGWRRAAVLALVHVIMIAHIIQWIITGRTLSPIEPSESMETLEQGLINAGFVFFSLAILSTMLFGRFMCGWGCHIIALQDACRWLMLKIGVRPRPFRSRLLMLVPLGLALYMFVWPNFKRWVVFPALEAMDVAAPVWLKPVAPFEGFETEFIVEDFWATFAAWPVAIPFLLVVGFASVYFLGSKGFCTYGCPYGGFFAPAEQLSPVRIRVTDNCEQCGHCTAACSSNVRVHEEVRDFGMIVDPGCMKCLDCVAVCPNDALYVGLGRPAIMAKPKDEAANERWKMVREKRSRMLDANWPEEIVVLLAFFVLFWSYRGMMGLVPMLMAVGIAGAGAFAVLMGLKMLREPNVRLQNIQLKLKGRIKPAGLVFALALCAMLVGAAWSGTARFNRWQSELLHAQILVPSAAMLGPDFQASASDASRAQRAMTALERADGFGAGGLGWRLTADELVRRAFLELVLGERAKAEATLREVIERGNPTDALVFEVASLMGSRGASDEEIGAVLERALELHPELHGVRREVAVATGVVQGFDAALAVWDETPPEIQDTFGFAIARARYAMSTRDAEAAKKHVLMALERAPHHGRHSVGPRLDVVEILLALGDEQEAAATFDAVARVRLRSPESLMRVAAVAGQLGREDEAVALIEQATEIRHASAGVLLSASQYAMQAGNVDGAAELIREAAHRVRRSAYESMQVGIAMLTLANQAQRTDLVDEGMAMFDHALTLTPDASHLHAQYAILLGNLGRMDEAATSMIRAAELGDRNVALAQRAAELLGYIGRQDEARAWNAEAVKRARRD